MRTTPVRAGIPTALLATLLVSGLAACAGDASPGATTSPEESTPPAASPTPTPTEEPGAEADVAVYYLVDSRAGLRLARELRTVTAEDASDVAVPAVEAMIAGPQDPDYSSAWVPATHVLGVEVADGVAVVDLSAEARTASIGSEGAALMIQQLVWTVTEAIGDPAAGVLLTVEGAPAGDLWGVVRWDEPVVRQDPLDVRHFVQIDEPREGATATSPLTVTGDAAVFEATLLWAVRGADGTTVAEGFTNTAEGQTFAPYAFELELPPGTYTVEISESDPSDGEGGPPSTDTRTITIG